jgi:hypothetical protein
MKNQSEEYFDTVRLGPFPGMVDPWAEEARHFHQIHGRMMGFIAEQMQPALFAIGYQAGCETSLQIIENRIPDVYIRSRENLLPEPFTRTKYGTAAIAVAAEPGVPTEMEVPPLDAVYIYNRATNDLVTIIELVSPGNKEDMDSLIAYRRRRDGILSKGVHVVEIDLIRSRNHLLNDPPVIPDPYHYAVYLAVQEAVYIGCDFLTPLKRVAIPLREEVVPLDPQPTYDAAYRQVLLAGHILREMEYQTDYLPQPSLVTVSQRKAAQEQVKAWKARLGTMNRAAD